MVLANLPARPRRLAASALVLATILVLATAPANAQVAEPYPDWPLLTFTAGAVYAGPGGTGRPALLSVTLGEDGAARGTLLEATPARGEAPGLDFAFDGTFERVGDVVRVGARAWPRTTGGALQSLVVELPVLEGGTSLDPFASATVTLQGADTRLELAGVGTMLDGELALADGSLGVAVRSPFFYAEPWRSLQLDALARKGTDASLRDGLAQRRDLPDAVAGIWWDRRYATVESFDDDLVSVRILTDVFTGGAHPNTWRETRTYARTADGWRAVGLCEVLAALGHACDRAAIRESVIGELRRQEAAWVLDGEVDADTPWLLELFTLTPRGLRIEFDPYAVGPYVQGPFVVDLAFPLPND